jgi:topoisomerase-4 subunit A
VNLADLIDVKGMKAQGNQMTKLKVKEIVLMHPVDESPEPWPDQKPKESTNEEEVEILEEDEEGPTPSMEWDLTKKEEEDNEDQIKLF